MPLRSLSKFDNKCRPRLTYILTEDQIRILVHFKCLKCSKAKYDIYPKIKNDKADASESLRGKAAPYI